MLATITKLITDNSLIMIISFTALLIFVYFIKKLIDKDPFMILTKIKGLFESNIEIKNNFRRLGDIEKEESAKEITGYNREERKERYYRFIDDITIVAYLKKWNRRFSRDDMFDIFDKNKYSDDDIKKRIWNARLWLSNKAGIFCTDIVKLLDNLKNAYVDFDEDKYYNYVNYDFWDDVIIESVKKYTDRCVHLGMNKDFLDKITNLHYIVVDKVLSSAKKTINAKLFNRDPLIITEVILNSFIWGFDEAFIHIDDILSLNGELSDVLENWEIPNDMLDFEIKTKTNIIKDLTNSTIIED